MASINYAVPAYVMRFIKGLGYEDTYTPMQGYIEAWEGLYKAEGAFWNKTETTGKRKYKTNRRTVKPAKRVCREWASLMLNEDTLINVKNKKCNAWLEEYFNKISFWSKGQALIERAFALGTGAWGIWLDTAAKKLQVLRYFANMVIILSWDDAGVSEVGFVTKVTRKGKTYDQLQLHLLQEDGYHIVSRYWNSDGKEVFLDGVIEDFATHSFDPWFAVITPALDNTCVDLSPYGMSVFADAKDILESVDIAFDSFVAEPLTGRMRLFLADMLFQVEDEGKSVIPFGADDATVYRMIDANGEDLIKEFAPALRTSALLDTYRATLQSMGDACGFGVNYFDTDAHGGIRTATEVSSDNSQLMRNIRRHEKLLGDGIKRVVKGVLQAARRIGENLPDEGDISISFDDSIIQDTASEKQQDLAEVGITMNAWEYRMKWYGEDEATAKANAPRQAAYTFEAVE